MGGDQGDGRVEGWLRTRLGRPWAGLERLLTLGDDQRVADINPAFPQSSRIVIVLHIIKSWIPKMYCHMITISLISSKHLRANTCEPL